MLSLERKNAITAYLIEDEERAKELFNMMPEEAVAKMNADGYDFNLDEVREYGEQLKAAAQSEGELNEAELDNVSGGLGTLAVVAIYGACAAGGFGVGVCAYKGWW